MDLTKSQHELLEALKENKIMYHDWNGKSPTQFNLNTARVLDKNGLAKLTYIAEVGSTITHKLEFKEV
jgi:hypothetical protein